MRSRIALPVSLLVVLGAGAATAQVPNGTPLNLLNFTATLEISPSQQAMFVSGEQPWWGPYQLPPQPFALGATPLAEGLPPNAAWPARLAGTIKQSSASYPSPYFGGYSGEGEAYPNADMAADLAAANQANAPISYNNGVIALTASKMDAAESETLPAQLADRGYVSGALNTYPYSQQYGYFEETAEVPSGPGFWSAFWMVPENMNPSCASGVSCDTEIDVMEILGASPNILYSTLHTSDTTSHSYPSLTKAYTAPNGALSGAMHRYGVDWEPTYITFYLDGVAFCSAPTPADMRQPMYIKSNLAIGTANTWAGAPTTKTKFPGSYMIGAIRAWSSPNTVTISASKK